MKSKTIPQLKKKYILLKLTNGEWVKANVDDVAAVVVATENEAGELFVTRTVKIPELFKIVEYPDDKAL